MLDFQLIKSVIKPRQTDSHKGTYGRVLLIGGLYPYGGAIIMSALACVNSGAGLVTVATDSANIAALHSHLPEAMAFDMADSDLLTENLAKADVVLIGPGLSENSRAQATFDFVLDHLETSCRLIIDGSALNLLAKRKESLHLTNQLVLTPHQKEWERLSGLSMSEQTDAASQVALCHFPKETILVAKSQATKVLTKDRSAAIEAGGPYQATGGMGDTLCGMIAGFLAQFGQTDAFDVVLIASWLHSAIADHLAKDAYVVLPTQISQEIPRWMKSLSQGKLID
ncbi:NAD(P)H-hydrate dehydratase [Streptococcus loxodontisalivarius]|uniref:ADP-dependent (S)-NAD(P)H-hydrate dehydratase n=1 Tax=Streptococcus loxodontisalivarius TaxID=1349415 RepID=A0ABS2PUE8_9STRE|nr:NAD(P)H-hydrate dehydratase [Streptococcus loxodontisalivarius]MBM7643681.1 hydroxyethylthiazole kinase-like uncharacterized protein yjeF [Streptococcus loxodontisalivarius]